MKKMFQQFHNQSSKPKKPTPSPRPKPEIKARPVDPKSKLATPFGRVARSYTYGDLFPSGWLHHAQRQVF